jgi:hypothetical protein
MAEQVQLRIEPSSDRFDSIDDRWLEQVDGLVEELDQEVGGVDRDRRPVEGGKGFDLAAIVLSLGSAGAFTATVELVKSWLSRDRSRSVRLSWSETGEVREVELKGSDLDDAAFDEIVRSAAQRLAGST